MIELTCTGKDTLVIENPVMPAAGTFGYDGAAYRDLLDLTKLGAIVTTPITWKPRRIARGPRVVPLPSGVLIHTGLPNPGVGKVIKRYAQSWKRSLAPVIVHVVATTPHEVANCVGALDHVEGVAGIELGLHDQVTPEDIEDLLGAALDNTLRPILVRVPLYSAVESARVAESAGAGGLVVAASPRGTTRDPVTGQLVGGRIYGPWLKAQTLRAVGLVAHVVNIPVIGSGGIHNADDARDFLEAGAVAVQVDSVTWVEPRRIEIIARNLGGLELTRASGAYADEWEPGIGITMQMQRQGDPEPYDDTEPSVPPPMPPDLPE
ncbi:MAG: nitronate monooxygenase [Anaerolineae bacterium]|nr:nitronate monooxygenase [Anaerolineae bacterium]